MELSPLEIKFIGAYDESLNKCTKLRRIATTDDPVFSAFYYTFKVNNAYKKFVGFGGSKIEEFVEKDEISKYRDGGGFFPIYASSEGLFTAIDSVYLNNHLQYIEKRIGKYVNIERENEEVKISCKDPSKQIIEFDIKPQNIGVKISVLERVE